MNRMYDVWRDWFVATDRAPRVFVIAAWIAWLRRALLGRLVSRSGAVGRAVVRHVVDRPATARTSLCSLRLLLTPIWMLTHDFRAPMWIDAVALSASPIANRPRSCGLDRSSASFSRSVLSQRCGQVRLVGTPLLGSQSRAGRAKCYQQLLVSAALARGLGFHQRSRRWHSEPEIYLLGRGCTSARIVRDPAVCSRV